MTSRASLPAAEMRNLNSLQVLDLRHNKFKEVPPVVYELPALQTLYLRFNKIKELHPAIGNLTVSIITMVTLAVT